MKLCDKKDCTGCFACKQVCPKNAITISVDNMGFCYPEIDDIKCVNCGKCHSVCHVCSKITSSTETKKIYRYKGPEKVRLESSSGGFFTLIASFLLSKGYHVVGVVFDEDYYGAHYEITDSFDRIKLMRKSKYIEAKLNDVYKDSKKILQNGGKILFTGIPCHIAGFLKYLNGKYSNQIVTLDLLCFGNGSSYLYKCSLAKFVENNQKNGVVEKVDFRHKPFCEGSHTVMDILIGKELYSMPANSFPYYYGYVNRLVFRNSCYKCIYNKINRITDFTIGDVPGDHDPLGENLVLCNSQKSLDIIQCIQSFSESGAFILADDKLVGAIREKLSCKRIEPPLYSRIAKQKDVNLVIAKYLKANNKKGVAFLFRKICLKVKRIFTK
jgi:coenzyme F420-reducing hydrogenase beta subunit